MAVPFSPNTGSIFQRSPFLVHIWIPRDQRRQLIINEKLCLNKDHYLYFTHKKSDYILKQNICFVETKVRCFFRISGYSVLFWDCNDLMKRPITEYMDIFIKETNIVALAESKKRAFQL